MTASPRVTVLMAVYNGSGYVEAAIRSILTQTFTDFEFVIVDDGSTDHTAETIAAFADPRIRLMRNERNVGLTKSLNRGLAVARAPVVARQDADDVSWPTRLQRQRDFLDAHPSVAVVGAQVRIINEQGWELFGRPWWKATTPLGARWQLLFDSPCVHGAVMFRSRVIPHELGGYTESFQTSQDFELWSRVAQRYEIQNLPDTLLDFRTHGASVSAAYSEEQVSRIADVFRMNLESILQHGHVPLDWPATWVSITNPRVTQRAVAAKPALSAIGAIYERFVSLYPPAAASAEVQSHLSSVYARTGRRLVRTSPAGALRAYARAAACDPGMTFGQFASYAARRVAQFHRTPRRVRL